MPPWCHTILKKRTLLAWSGLFLGLAALATSQWALDRQHRKTWAAERDFQSHFDEVYAAVIPYYLQSPALVTSGLNGGTPLQGTTAKESRGIGLVTGGIFDDRPALPADADPRGLTTSFRATLPGRALGPRYEGWVVHLHFVDGQLRGASTVSPPHLAYTPPAAWVVLVEVVRPALVILGAVAWCLCAALIPMHRPWRQSLARVALAGLLVAGVALVLERGTSLFPHTLAGLIRPVPVALAAAVALTLAGAVLPPRRRPEPTGPAPCGGCGYDLTGNESGACPECGRITPRGRIDRWQEQADKIAGVECDPVEETERPAVPDGSDESDKSDEWDSPEPDDADVPDRAEPGRRETELQEDDSEGIPELIASQS